MGPPRSRGGLGGIVPPGKHSAANLAASSAGSLKVPSGFTLPAVGALTAPGMCPATGSTGSVSPR